MTIFGQDWSFFDWSITNLRKDWSCRYWKKKDYKKTFYFVYIFALKWHKTWEILQFFHQM